MSMPKIYDVATERPPEISVRNLPLGRRMEITGADLLTIAAKIAIISDISTCKGLLFCELTHESGGFALPLLNERVSFSRLFKVRGVFQPIGHDKRTTSDKDCVVFLCTALGCPNSGGNIGINGTH